MNGRGPVLVALAAFGAVVGVVAAVSRAGMDHPPQPSAPTSATRRVAAPTSAPRPATHGGPSVEPPRPPTPAPAGKPPGARVATPPPAVVPAEPAPPPAKARPSPTVEDVTVEPTGAYAKIDGQVDELRAMNGADAVVRAAASARAEAHPEKCSPPLLFALGRALFDAGRKEDGAFWYYAGMLRGRCDIMRCTDASVGDAVRVMIQTYGPPISPWVYRDLDALEKRIERVVAWDEKAPHDYDVRWINLHGMGAVLSGLPAREDAADAPEHALSKPRAEWPAIEKDAREKFVAGWRLILAELRKKQR